MRVHAPHCPNCAAALRFDEHAHQVDCEYCGATLILERSRVSMARSVPASPQGEQREREARPALIPPPASLATHDVRRFSLRILEQRGAPLVGDLFRWVPLPEDRFALVAARTTDDAGEPLPLDLEPAWLVMVASLEDDGDPGLAVNFALEELARDPRFRRLICALVVLDPARTTALAYAAGTTTPLYWLSTEEARPIAPVRSARPLEKSDLVRVGDQFHNGAPFQLAANDVIVVPSLTYFLDRAASSNVAHRLTETLREHLAEDPLRVVTLAKNAFWEARSKSREAHEPLVGDLAVAAVGARLADEGEVELEPHRLEVLETPKFSVALQRTAGDAAALWPLHGQRHAVLWATRRESAGAVSAAEFEVARAAVNGVLDRREHGDNDNGGAAAKAAYEALGPAGEELDLLVLHLSDEYQRVKYFHGRLKPAIVLGARGLRADHEQQLFSSRGEVTLPTMARLLFLGGIEYEGDAGTAERLAKVWFGGKSSHLYEAMRLHWRTRSGEAALKRLVRATAADVGAAATRRLALVTGK